MFHPTLRTVSVLQKCMLNLQEYAVNDCRPRDREKTKAEQKRKRKKSLPQHQTGKNILIFSPMSLACPEKINHSHGHSVPFKESSVYISRKTKY